MDNRAFKSVIAAALAAGLGLAPLAGSAEAQLVLPPKGVITQPFPITLVDPCWNGILLNRADPTCLAKEQARFASAAQSNPNQQTVTLPDGSTAAAAVEAYDHHRLHQLSSSEATFSSFAWPGRYAAATTQTAFRHPEFEGDAPEVNSCDEYSYKRFYQANRYLETLGAFTRPRDAFAFMFAGGGVGTAALAPLPNSTLADYDHHPITDYAGNAIGDLHSPADHTQPKNSFYLANPFMARYGGAGDAAFVRDLDLALAQVGAAPFVDVPDEWAFAQSKNADLTHRYALSDSEMQEIAQRLDAFDEQVGRFGSNVSICIMKHWRSISASANLATGVAYDAADLYRSVIASRDPGTIDPAELALVQQLLDVKTSATTLSQLLGVNLADKRLATTIAKMARTPVGALVRSLSARDAGALTSTLKALQANLTAPSTPNAITGDNSECAIAGDAASKAMQALVAEYRRGAAGCLGSDRCDFSVPRFVTKVTARVTAVLAPADLGHDRCVTLFGNKFDGATKVDPASRTTLASFDTFMTNKIAALEAAKLNAPRGTTLANGIGDGRSGGTDWGDESSFAAGYSYAGEWGVNVLERTASNQICRLGAKASGSLKAHVTAFGSKQELIDAGLSATTEQLGSKGFPNIPASLEAHLRLAGDDVFTPVKNQDALGNHHFGSDGHEDIPLIETVIVVGIVPVSLQAGVTLDYGADMTVGLTVGPCNPQAPKVSVDNSFTPHVGVDAYLSASVDLLIVAAGVKGRLTLIKASLPLASHLTIAADAAGDVAITPSSSLDLVLTELSGSFSVFVRFAFWTIEKQLFSWDGLSQTVHLWSDQTTVPIGALEVL